jgi:hypothetical protein
MSAAPTPNSAPAQVLSLKQVLICGALIVTLSMGIRHGFGLWLQPITVERGWTRETFAFALAVQNLAWGVAGYAVSYIAPHTLTARALVVAPDDVLEVVNHRSRDGVDIVVDGVEVGGLEPGTGAEVRFRSEMASLAQLPGANFYQRIREKFGHLAQ